MNTHDNKQKMSISSDTSSSSALSDNDDDWIEMETTDETTDIICLFCDKLFPNINDDCIHHLKSDHHFDLDLLKCKFHMSDYSYINLIKYILHNSSSADEIMNAKHPFWDVDNLNLPLPKQHAWLMFDFNGLNFYEESEENSDPVYINSLKEQIKEKDLLLEQANAHLQTMKESYHRLFEAYDKPSNISIVQNGNCVANIPNDVDRHYFDTYSHFGIHHQMLSDEVRTTSYQNAILNNANQLKGKIVMDLGCGTAILTMFASKAGAELVVAVDESDIIYKAMDIARLNNITNIRFVKGRIENTEIEDNRKVDVIISEWMGYFLLFEGMLDSVIYARDHHLKPNGLLLPNRCTISIIGYGDLDRHKEFIQFWNNVYGFNMSCLQKDVLNEAVIEICNRDFVLTNPNVLADFNLMTVTVDCTNFTYDFKLEVTKNGWLTSLVGYFDTFFELDNPVMFSTSPNDKPTHWKQIVFYIKNPIAVNAGDIINGTFICRRNDKDPRTLIIKVKMFDQILNYFID